MREASPRLDRSGGILAVGHVCFAAVVSTLRTELRSELGRALFLRLVGEARPDRVAPVQSRPAGPTVPGGVFSFQGTVDDPGPSLRVGEGSSGGAVEVFESLSVVEVG